MSRLQESDYDCPVCFKLLYSPISISCGHSYCKSCWDQVPSKPSYPSPVKPCPLCRAEQPLSQQLRVNILLAKVLESEFSEQYTARKQESQQELAERRRRKTVHMKFAIGNHHALQDAANEETQNVHQWTAFVRLSDSREPITDYISSVEFILHPTFNPPRVHIRHAPFQVKRLGWGVFQVGIRIHWNPQWSKGVTELAHMLSFRGDGQFRELEEEFSRQLTEEEFQAFRLSDDEVEESGQGAASAASSQSQGGEPSQ